MKEIIGELRPKIREIFEHLHQHPELSWKEVETTKYIAKLLAENNCAPVTFDDCTGVIATLGSGWPIVAIRADMDALWQEVDGTFKANHSCGHDAHMTLGLGVFLTLKKLGLGTKGTVKFIFQPAEEKGNGALKIIEKKVLDDVDYLYGVHLRPVQEVEGGQASPAIIHGAGQFIAGKINGYDAHGARPHLGTNAIEVGAAIVEQLKGIYLDPMTPYSVKMTMFRAGGENANIIPGSAEFSLDLRAQTNTLMDELRKKVEHVIDHLSKLYHVNIELFERSKIVAAQVNREAQEIMADAIKAVLGQENCIDPVITSGGEDFHYYSVERPHLKATMLGLGCDLKPGLHHPHMTFNREALFDGVAILTKAILTTLERHGKDSIYEN